MQWDPDYTHRGNSEKYSNAGRPVLAQGKLIRVLKFQCMPENSDFPGSARLSKPSNQRSTELSEQKRRKSEDLCLFVVFAPVEGYYTKK